VKKKATGGRTKIPYAQSGRQLKRPGCALGSVTEGKKQADIRVKKRPGDIIQFLD